MSDEQHLISVSVLADPDGEQTRSLRRWLQRDNKVAKSPDITPSTPQPDPEAMSSALDWLDFAVSSAIGLSSLIVSIATWCSTRASGQQVRVSSDRGSSVVVSEAEAAPDRADERAAEVLGDGAPEE
ncbi:effector-associated constant component EACC1 [Streptomyces thermoalcalitolerans]|uniref:effector-associated constant component EACC1 n=1 Tax=Streptomyces thermoalcalitolerans TaxID=65605 RepID=UPI0031D995D8